MGHKRPKPTRLNEKLLAIRQGLGISQYKMALKLGIPSGSRIAEYESGRREPNLIMLLAYSQLADIQLELIINDRVDLAQFCDVLTKNSA
jgi:transcriptional regulator with XRE-family HTH domain